MSRATKRKHVVRELLEERVEPAPLQRIVRVLGTPGNNLHEVVTAEGTQFLASMPQRFRKHIWIKRGDFLLVDPIPEGCKVKAEICQVLLPPHVRALQRQGLWPEAFTPQERCHPPGLGDPEDPQELLVNPNRGEASGDSDSEEGTETGSEEDTDGTGDSEEDSGGTQGGTGMGTGDVQGDTGGTGDSENDSGSTGDSEEDSGGIQGGTGDGEDGTGGIQGGTGDSHGDTSGGIQGGTGGTKDRGAKEGTGDTKEEPSDSEEDGGGIEDRGGTREQPGGTQEVVGGFGGDAEQHSSGTREATKALAGTKEDEEDTKEASKAPAGTKGDKEDTERHPGGTEGHQGGHEGHRCHQGEH